MSEGSGKPRKRQRSSEPGQDNDNQLKKPRVDTDISLLMYVRWFGPSTGQTKVNVLPLRALDGLDQLQVRRCCRRSTSHKACMPVLLMSVASYMPCASLHALLLQELGKELVQKAYPEPQPLPNFLTSPDFCRFTPSRECLALPGRVGQLTSKQLLGTQSMWSLRQASCAMSLCNLLLIGLSCQACVCMRQQLHPHPLPPHPGTSASYT